jgi:carbon-monoxide dehydrogenase large subunit
MPRHDIGRPVPRREDPPLLRGQGHFIDDLEAAGLLHAWFVRSPHAHARVLGIDGTQALAMPGVQEVLTAAELAQDGLEAIHASVGLENVDGTPARLPPRPLLARDRVRHSGDAVAMVVATSREQARDAAECVAVDYQELAAVSDAGQALQPDAPLLFDSAPGNLALHWHGGDADAVARAFDGASHVSRLRVVNNRVMVAPMETRGAMAAYDPATGRYTVHAPSQGVNEVKTDLARALGVSAGEVQVITPEVGGAFGMKIPAYPEYVLCAWAARRLGRPVKWIAERGEAFMTDGQGRDHVMHAELAMDDEGSFLGIRCRTVSNAGAYGSAAVLTIPTAGGTRCITGVYRIPCWHADVHVAYTNTVPVLAYRGAGKPEYNYMLERLIDHAARELGVDAAELRRRNAVTPSQLPYATGTGLVFDSGDFVRNLDDALALIRRDGFEQRRAASRAAGRLRGLGFALFQEPDGYLDNRITLVFAPDGSLLLTLTGQTAGQGYETTFAQVAAAQLGIDPARIRVRQGDSDIVGPGRGTGGSRVATVASGGIVGAGDKIKHKARRLAAHMLEASVEDVEFSDGQLRIAGTDRGVSLAEVVAASFDAARLPADMEPGMEATHHYLAREYNYPCGCHACEVEIDLQTGALTLLDYVAVNDHGVVINPLLLDGQIHGGVVQGLGQAACELVHYDPDSAQLVSGSFMDYCLPRAADLPSLRVRHNPLPSRSNPLGVKGVGESGCTAACPTLMNAVADALAPLGISDVDMPVTPLSLWQRIRDAS